MSTAPASGVALRGWAASEAMIVAVGDGGRILRSVDGTTWEVSEMGFTEGLRGVAYGAGRFVAVGERGRIAVSEDGIGWTRAVSPTVAGLTAVAFGGGRFVAVAEDSGTVVSLDASAWTATVSGVTRALRGIAWMSGEIEAGGGVGMGVATFVAVGARGVALMSREGSAWERIYNPDQDDFLAMAADGRTFVALTRETVSGGTLIRGGVAQMSRMRDLRTLGIFHGAAFLPGTLHALAIGADGAAAALTAGVLRSVHSGSGRNLTAVGFGRGRFFAVGEGETIFPSGEVAAPDVATGALNTVRNLSTRAQVTGGSGTLISGLVVSGSGTKRLLVRGVGPRLAFFDVTRPLLRPTLTIYDASGRVVAQNSGWNSGAEPDEVRAMTRQVSAFTLPENSADAALIVRLPAGAYTAQVTGPETGVALVEIYDTEFWPESSLARLTNISSRCTVGEGEASVIAGVSLPRGRKLLVRGVGPGLGAFGVAGVLPDPVIDVVQPDFNGGTGTRPDIYLDVLFASNDDWNGTSYANPALRVPVDSPASAREMGRRTGAFPLQEGGKDAAMVVTLPGGNTTINLRGTDGTGGVALVEVYDLGGP